MQLEQLLKINNLKCTKIRCKIIELFCSCRPLSAQEILSQVSNDVLRPNKSTIYRELTILQKAGILQPMSFDGKTTVYEFSGDENHHHHAVCVNCNTYWPVECDGSCRQNNGAKFLDGFKLINKSINLFGYCKKCQGKK